MSVAFEILPDGKKPPKSHQCVQCHMLFNIKMEDFRCKARLVAGGHVRKAPATITYKCCLKRDGQNSIGDHHS